MILRVCKLATTIIVVALSFVTLRAQDLHFSQFDAAPLYYNPALAGVFDGKHRFIANLKSQWITYKTLTVSYDRMLPFDFGGTRLGLGAMINYDQAGTTAYGYRTIRLLPAIHRDIVPDEKLSISFGLDISMTQNVVDQSKISSESVINGEPADLQATSKYYTDLSAGVNLHSNVKHKYPVNVGITLYHITKPGNSFITEAKTIDVDRRFSVNSNTIIPLSKRWSLLPSLIYLRQKEFYQLNTGSYARYDLTPVTDKIKAVYVGSWFRYGDAAVIGVAVDLPGFKKNHNLNIGMSYDVSVGDYRQTSNVAKNTKVGTDSYELSIKYIIKQAPFKWQPPVKLNPVNM